MFPRSIVLLTASLCVIVLSAARSFGGVAVLQQSLVLDQAAGDATFTIDFPHAPDFYTVDQYGRPADSFQIEISSDINSLTNLTSVIRGDEIQYAHALRIRDASPPDLSDPQSGGWGAIRGTAPITVTGDDVSFTAPLSVLGVPNGQFVYRAFTLSDGVIQAEAQAQSVPLPSGLTAALLTIAMIVAAKWLLERRSASASGATWMPRRVAEM